MKIGFDGKRALSNMTGLGNYSRLIIESMAKEYPLDEITVYAPKPQENPRIRSWAACPNIVRRYPQKGEARFGRSLWRTFGITGSLRADKIEIFHGLSNELPLNIAKAGIPSVVTIHDVIYRTLPYCYKPIDRHIYDYKYGRSCRNATAIIAISECTKRDIMRFYDVPEEKITVIYQGCDASFSTADTQKAAEADREALSRLRLPERYLVQVGTIERRKNALLSVRALSAIEDKTVKLLLIGRPTGYLQKVMEEACRLGVADRIEVRSHIPFAQLPAVVRNATAALYPSRYEGFGLPVLEAISCGTPMIAATGSCLEEAGGPDTIYVDPDDTSAMRQAIDTIISDKDVAERMRAQGLLFARRFNNDEVASRTRALYTSLLRG